MVTRTHSSLVSFSSRILSRFTKSSSSQRSSSTKTSTHCGKEVMNIDLFLQLVTHILFSFCTIKHKLNLRLNIYLNLNCFPHIFSLWRGAFLISGERCYSQAKYWHLPWLQLPLPAPPHHGRSVYVRLAVLDRNGATCCRSRWAFVLPGWWHVRDSCCLWVTELGKFVD